MGKLAGVLLQLAFLFIYNIIYVFIYTFIVFIYTFIYLFTSLRNFTLLLAQQGFRM